MTAKPSVFRVPDCTSPFTYSHCSSPSLTRTAQPSALLPGPAEDLDAATVRAADPDTRRAGRSKAPRGEEAAEAQVQKGRERGGDIE